MNIQKMLNSKRNEYMKIQRVYIDGFKNLNEVNVSFDGITALVSLNNIGKSNFLLGINFGISFIKASEEYKKQLLSKTDFIPLNRGCKDKNFVFEIEMVSELNKVECNVVYRLECKWNVDESMEIGVLNERLRIKQIGKSQKYETFIDRKKTSALYKGSETASCVSKIQISNYDLAINKLKSFDKLFYNEILQKLNKLTIYMEDILDARNFYYPEPLIKKGLGNVMFEEENLPKMLYNLKENYPDKFELLEYTYKLIFPDISEIYVKNIDFHKEKLPDDFPYVYANQLYFLMVRDVNYDRAIDFRLMSDGAKRMLVVLTRFILAEICNVSLIAIEEPENSIHPSLLNTYLQVIDQLLDNCRVVMTSHSPYIVNCLNENSIYVGIKGNCGAASFKKLNSKLLLKDATNVEINTGDYLFTVLAEGTINNYIKE